MRAVPRLWSFTHNNALKNNTMRQNTQNETYIIIDTANNSFQKHTNHTAIYSYTVNPYYKVNPESQLQGKNPDYN